MFQIIALSTLVMCISSLSSNVESSTISRSLDGGSYIRNKRSFSDQTVKIYQAEVLLQSTRNDNSSYNYYNFSELAACQKCAKKNLENLSGANVLHTFSVDRMESTTMHSVLLMTQDTYGFNQVTSEVHRFSTTNGF